MADLIVILGRILSGLSDNVNPSPKNTLKPPKFMTHIVTHLQMTPIV